MSIFSFSAFLFHLINFIFPAAKQTRDFFRVAMVTTVAKQHTTLQTSIPELWQMESTWEREREKDNETEEKEEEKVMQVREEWLEQEKWGREWVALLVVVVYLSLSVLVHNERLAITWHSLLY